jgi:hypothetical protein
MLLGTFSGGLRLNAEIFQSIGDLGISVILFQQAPAVGSALLWISSSLQLRGKSHHRRIKHLLF